MILAVSAAFLRLISDVYIFVLFFRALSFVFKHGIKKGKTFLIIIMFFTVAETLLIFATRMTHTILNQFHGVIIVFLVELWAPVNRFLQFAGFMLFFSHQCSKQIAAKVIPPPNYSMQEYLQENTEDQYIANVLVKKISELKIQASINLQQEPEESSKPPSSKI